MADTTIDGALIPLTAALSWKAGRTLPTVVLSFDGLNEPTPLFSELASIGWQIPAVPPRPSSAIEWTPDPVAGTDYTVHPWKVEDFPLGRGAWSSDDEERVAAQTIESLQRYAAEIDGPEALVRKLKAQAPAVTVPVAAPSGAPQLVLLGYEGAPHPQFRPVTAETGGRKRVEVSWTECVESPATVCPSAEAREALASDSAHAWEVDYVADAVMPTDASQVAICASIPGTSVDDKKLNKIVRMLGGNVQVASLTPLDPNTGISGAFVFGVVPAKAAELAISTIRLKCSGSVVRTDG